MLLTKNFTTPFSWVEMRLAIKITNIVLWILVLAIAGIIFLNGLYLHKSEESKFLNEISLFRSSIKGNINFYDSYQKEWFFTNYDQKEVWNRLMRDTVVIADGGTIYKRGMFELLSVDPKTMPDAYILTQSTINGRDYLLFKAQISKDWVLFSRDITYIKDFQSNLIYVWGVLGLIIFVIILISSFYISKISFAPVHEANRKLKEYNYHVAHELRTPLSVIKWGIDIALLSWDLRDLDGSQEELHGLEKIISSLLFLWENTIIKEKDTFKMIDEVDKIINTFKEKKTFIIKKNITWLKITAHKVLFERLLTNLIENAIKYSSDDHITILIDKSFFEIQNQIDFDVDTKELNRVFEPFYKIDSSRSTPWYGLWLSIVKRIIEIFKWQIEAKVKNKTFIIRVTF